MGEQTIILLVEDNDGDAVLVDTALREGPGAAVDVRRVTRLEDGVQLATSVHTDVVLLDLSLPDSTGLETVRTAVEQLAECPIVVLTGTDDEQLAQQAVHLGAQDYLVKGHFDGDTLGRVIRYAIERFRTTRELRATNQQLQEANRLKDDFVAIASHELRTPVTVISGGLQTILGRWDDIPDTDRTRVMESVRRQSDRLVALVEDLLVLSRIEGGVLEVQEDDVDLGTLVADAVEASQLPITDVLVRARGGDTARSDADHLSRILVNLLDNAHKYGAPPVELTCAVVGGELELCVRDHGPGVQPDVRARLFERFVRSGASEVRRESGTGLGLAIVAALCAALGGRVTYEDAVGGGARFTVRVPSVHRRVGVAPEHVVAERPVGVVS